jgi:hypothetical protein
MSRRTNFHKLCFSRSVFDFSMRHLLLSSLHQGMLELAAVVPSLQVQSASTSAKSGASAKGDESTSGRIVLAPSLLNQVLYASPAVDFIRRWNVLSYLQQRAVHWINVNHFSQALPYVRAASHDATEMARLIQTELQHKMEATLQCGQDSGVVEDAMSSLPLASGHTTPSAVTFSWLRWSFFVFLELSFLLFIVVAVTMCSLFPDRMAGYLPKSMARAVGLAPARWKPHYV